MNTFELKKAQKYTIIAHTSIHLHIFTQHLHITKSSSLQKNPWMFVSCPSVPCPLSSQFTHSLCLALVSSSVLVVLVFCFFSCLLLIFICLTIKVTSALPSNSLGFRDTLHVTDIKRSNSKIVEKTSSSEAEV